MIRVFADIEELCRGVAALFGERTQQAVTRRGSCSVVLAGDVTSCRVYEQLALPPYSRFPWSSIDWFWEDERSVPLSDPRSNEGQARKLLFDHVPVPAERIHGIRCADDPTAAARAYEELLRAHFRHSAATFDSVLLGVGEDGHTASLFPHGAAVAERDRWVVPVLDHDPPSVTLTLAALNAARCVVFAVAGGTKAGVMHRMLEEPGTPPLPAELVRPKEGELFWLVERCAAVMLDPKLQH